MNEYNGNSELKLKILGRLFCMQIYIRNLLHILERHLINLRKQFTIENDSEFGKNLA